MSEFVTLARPYAKAAFDYAKEAGLVSEWLQQLTVSAGLASMDEIADTFNSPEKNPQGPDYGVYRVLRGGAWSFLSGELEVNFRGGLYPRDGGGDFFGFRLARTP